MAKIICASIMELEASHFSIMSKPEEILKVIKEAIASVYYVTVLTQEPTFGLAIWWDDE